MSACLSDESCAQKCAGAGLSFCALLAANHARQACTARNVDGAGYVMTPRLGDAHANSCIFCRQN